MKTLRNLLLAAFMLATFGLSAQYWTPSGPNIYNNNSGFVGIGISTPTQLLTVSKNMTAPAIEVHNTGGAGGAAFRMLDDASGAQWNFKATASGGFKIRDIASGLDVIQIEQNSAADVIYIKSSGSVGIGTSTTKTGYRLSVAGNIACEEVLVESSGSWPDYVFDEGYELMSLDQLEKNIEQNNHLPGMPSAVEVKENGISLGEMQRVFLEKLEELTLYTIEQDKQIKEQQLRSKEQQLRIEALEQENKKLKK